jgi:hypothetical protein
MVLRPARVVDEESIAVGQIDLPHRHADAVGDLDVDPLDGFG